MSPNDPGRYWNHAMETISRERLAVLQLAKLKAQLAHAYAGSAFYRRVMGTARLDPAAMDSLDEFFARFPILERADLVAAEAAAPPYGTLAAISPRYAIARHQTSGSSGQPPFRSFDTARDWAWLTDRFALGLYALGVRPGDQVAVAFGYGPFLGFWAGHYALQRIGATPISTGSFDTERRIRLLTQQAGIGAFICTPTYALRMAYVAREMGVNLATDTNVRLVITSGEGRPPATCRAIEEAWGARCGEVAGMTEAGFIMFECGPGSKGLHLIESDFIEEVLDAETRQRVPYGQQGVRVLTSLGRESIPMLRYWTNDLVIRKPFSECGCGRTWDFYEGGILGRTDDVVKVRGCLLTPAMVEDVLRSFTEVAEFRAIVETVDALDTLVITIEPHAGLAAEHSEPLAARVAAETKRTIGVRPHVRLAAPGTLPRFEMKAKRFGDARGEKLTGQTTPT